MHLLIATSSDLPEVAIEAHADPIVQGLLQVAELLRELLFQFIRGRPISCLLWLNSQTIPRQTWQLFALHLGWIALSLVHIQVLFDCLTFALGLYLALICRLISVVCGLILLMLP